MRGPSAGALTRTYLHSGITEGLWCAVAERESLFGARLAHAVMLSALSSHPRADLGEGNDLIHEMYLNALHTLPYIKVTRHSKQKETDELVAEWRRVNAEAAARQAAAGDVATGAGEEGGDA